MLNTEDTANPADMLEDMLLEIVSEAVKPLPSGEPDLDAIARAWMALDDAAEAMEGGYEPFPSPRTKKGQ